MAMISSDNKTDHYASGLPEGWASRPADLGDVEAMTALQRHHEERARGWPSVSAEQIAVAIDDSGKVHREHLVLSDPDGQLRAWCEVHDRAAGRVVVTLVVDPDLSDAIADRVAAALLTYARQTAITMASDHGLVQTELDSDAFSDDTRQARWLAQAGLGRIRTWWHMARPVQRSEAADGALPAPNERVRLRRVAPGYDGMPDIDDLRTVHDVLEEAFADHFNSHEESFDGFVARLREDPNHRWDDWWIAEIIDGDIAAKPAGALVGAVIPGSDDADDPSPAGTYVEYIGVLRSARGRGVATSLIHAVVADAARRDRHRVALEVDADSPTGAQGLYASLGFTTKYTTETWQTYLEC